VEGGGKLTGGDYDRGFFIEPAIFRGVRPDMRIAREEIFGPVLAIIEAADYDQAVAIANDVDYGLAASICTRDLSKAARFARAIEAGKGKKKQPPNGGEPTSALGGVEKYNNPTCREDGGVA